MVGPYCILPELRLVPLSTGLITMAGKRTLSTRTCHRHNTVVCWWVHLLAL